MNRRSNRSNRNRGNGRRRIVASRRAPRRSNGSAEGKVLPFGGPVSLPISSIRREMGPSARSLIGGFNDRKRVTLRYVETVLLTSTSGAEGSYVFRGNGPYDPNQTGTGGQPDNWDDYALQYYGQHTLGSRCFVQFTINTNTNVGMRVSLCPQIATPITTVDDMTSRPYAKSLVYNTYNSGSVIAAQMSSMRRLGLTKAQLVGSDQCGSSTATLPSQQWYWVLGYGSSDKSTTVAGYATFTIDYDILFHTRLDENLNRHVSAKLSAAKNLVAGLEKKLWLSVDTAASTQNAISCGSSDAKEEDAEFASYVRVNEKPASYRREQAVVLSDRKVNSLKGSSATGPGASCTMRVESLKSSGRPVA